MKQHPNDSQKPLGLGFLYSVMKLMTSTLLKGQSLCPAASYPRLWAAGETTGREDLTLQAPFGL